MHHIFQLGIYLWAKVITKSCLRAKVITKANRGHRLILPFL